MENEFVDSEICKLDGKTYYHFQHPNVLRDKIIETISNIGAEKFFKGPDKNIKKVREGVPEYFFILALRKLTQFEWWIQQPEKDPPDFITIPTNIGTDLSRVRFGELVEIPSQCKSFEEMFSIFDKKRKKGYSTKYSLIVFINHQESKNWINLFDNKLTSHKPFREIWGVYLLWYKGGHGFYGAVIERLRPYPKLKIQYKLNDEMLRNPLPIPNHISEIERGGKKFYNLNPPIKKLIKITKTTKI